MVGADSVQEKNTAGWLADKRLTSQQNRGNERNCWSVRSWSADVFCWTFYVGLT